MRDNIRDKERKREYKKRQYAANPERFRAESTEYRRKNPDKVKSASKRYYRENRELINIRAHIRRVKLREETISAYGGVCSICGEACVEFLCIDHVANNGGVERRQFGGGVCLYGRLKIAGFPRDGYRLLCFNCNQGRMLTERMVPCKDEKQRRYSRKLRAEMLQAYGGVCVCCGEDNPVFLALDHTNGGGQKDRIQNGLRGRLFYSRLRTLGWPRDDYRLLCHNCNMSRSIFGYCPHE